jgi:hypothetical protein
MGVYGRSINGITSTLRVRCTLSRRTQTTPPHAIHHATPCIRYAWQEGKWTYGAPHPLERDGAAILVGHIRAIRIPILVKMPLHGCGLGGPTCQVLNSPAMGRGHVGESFEALRLCRSVSFAKLGRELKGLHCT